MPVLGGMWMTRRVSGKTEPVTAIAVSVLALSVAAAALQQDMTGKPRSELDHLLHVRALGSYVRGKLDAGDIGEAANRQGGGLGLGDNAPADAFTEWDDCPTSCLAHIVCAGSTPGHCCTAAAPAACGCVTHNHRHAAGPRPCC